MKKTLLFCTGLSGSGKSYFIKHNLNGLFYKLRSATTRPRRPGEINGNEYFFCNEAYFETADFVTHLWVNEAQWTPGKPKWLYGVPTTEMNIGMGHHLVYDVIQPRYAREMIDWCCAQGLDQEYDFRLAYFIAPENNFETAARRANMPDDLDVRKNNTCTPVDFLRAGLDIDYLMMPRAGMVSPKLMQHLAHLRAREK